MKTTAYPVMTRSITWVFAAALLFLGPGATFGQSGSGYSGGSTSGLFGSRNLGLSSGSTPGTTNSGIGSGMTTGMGGSTTNGQSTTGTGNATGGPGMQMQSPTFVGATGANVTNFMSMLGAGQQQTQRANFSTLQNLINQSRQNTFNQQNSQRNSQGRGGRTQTQLVVPLRVGFQAPPVSAAAFNTSFSQRLSKIPAMSQGGQVEVGLVGRTAILRGTVASESDRQLAEMLVQLEPEVLQVQNELVVEQPAATLESLPAPLPGIP